MYNVIVECSCLLLTQAKFPDIQNIDIYLTLPSTTLLAILQNGYSLILAEVDCYCPYHIKLIALIINIQRIVPYYKD